MDSQKNVLNVKRACHIIPIQDIFKYDSTSQNTIRDISNSTFLKISEIMASPFNI